MAHKVSSPEAALILAENYVRLHFAPTDVGAENALGAVIWRDEEDPSLISPYEDFVMEYVRLEIKKHFGYTLDEYLELSFYEASILKKQAEKLKEEMNRIASNVQRDVANERKALKQQSDQLEDLMEEI